MDIVGFHPAMSTRVATSVRIGALVALVFLSASPSWADARGDAKEQVAFGINVAQRGLWREAIYRWEKAVELDPTYAAAFNDLAIAYEHEGQLDKARKAYEKALDLDPNNSQIRQNYELFKEINDRTNQGNSEKP
jgi:type IV pilus assembly protein PilF